MHLYMYNTYQIPLVLSIKRLVLLEEFVFHYWLSDDLPDKQNVKFLTVHLYRFMESKYSPLNCNIKQMYLLLLTSFGNATYFPVVFILNFLEDYRWLDVTFFSDSERSYKDRAAVIQIKIASVNSCIIYIYLNRWQIKFFCFFLFDIASMKYSGRLDNKTRYNFIVGCC